MGLLRRKANPPLSGDRGTGWVKRGEGNTTMTSSVSSPNMTEAYDFPAKKGEREYETLKARFLSDVQSRKRMLNPFKTLFDHMSFTIDWKDALNTKLDFSNFKKPIEIFEIFLRICSLDEAISSPKKPYISHYLVYAKLEFIVLEYFLKRLVAIKTLVDRMTSSSVTWDEYLKEELYLAKACCNILFHCLEKEELFIERLELASLTPLLTSELKPKLRSLWQELWVQEWSRAKRENPREDPKVLGTIQQKWPATLSI